MPILWATYIRTTAARFYSVEKVMRIKERLIRFIKAVHGKSRNP